MNGDPRQGGSWGGPVSAGFAVAVIVGLAVCAVSYPILMKKKADARRGWNLVPVVVAAVDIPAGETVTFDQISQRSVPEQFVTSSCVKPDSASYIVNQKILVPVQAGDPLLWSQFATGDSCTRFETLCKGVEAAPALSVPVLAVKRIVAVGEKLTDGDLVERDLPRGAFTASYLKPGERDQVLGKPALAPMQPGDPVMRAWFDPKAMAASCRAK